MWPKDGKTITGFKVTFTASDFPVSLGRRARLINDWSRVKVRSLKWFNTVSNENVPLTPPPNLKNNQYFDFTGISVQQSTWRFMFKDGQSRILSDTAENTGKIEYSLWITLVSGRVRQNRI